MVRGRLACGADDLGDRRPRRVAGVGDASAVDVHPPAPGVEAPMVIAAQQRRVRHSECAARSVRPIAVRNLAPRRRAIAAVPGAATVTGHQRPPDRSRHGPGARARLERRTVGAEHDPGQVAVREQRTDLGQRDGLATAERRSAPTPLQVVERHGHEHVRPYTVTLGKLGGAQREPCDGHHGVRAAVLVRTMIVGRPAAERRGVRSLQLVRRNAVVQRGREQATVLEPTPRRTTPCLLTRSDPLGRPDVGLRDQPSRLPPEGCRVQLLGEHHELLLDLVTPLRWQVADRVGDDRSMLRAQLTSGERCLRPRRCVEPPAGLSRALRLGGRKLQRAGEEVLGPPAAALLLTGRRGRNLSRVQLPHDPGPHRLETARRHHERPEQLLKLMDAAIVEPGFAQADNRVGHRFDSRRELRHQGADP